MCHSCIIWRPWPCVTYQRWTATRNFLSTWAEQNSIKRSCSNLCLSLIAASLYWTTNGPVKSPEKVIDIDERKLGNICDSRKQMFLLYVISLSDISSPNMKHRTHCRHQCVYVDLVHPRFDVVKLDILSSCLTNI